MTTRSFDPFATDPMQIRFGVNYTPSRDWWYCWTEWHEESIAKDLDAIREHLAADHVRVFPLWPFFQPNPGVVSPTLLARLGRLIELAEERELGVCVALLNGHLSGQNFRLPFELGEADPTSCVYTSERVWGAIERYVRAVGDVCIGRRAFLGFDLANEMNMCWQAPTTEIGDAFLRRAMALLDEVAPGKLNVNGADHQPWFDQATFSPQALATVPKSVAVHAWAKFTGALELGGPLDPPALNLAAGMTLLAKSHANDPAKPVWLQEYGMTRAWVDEAVLPTFAERATTAALKAGAGWITWWCSHDVARKFSHKEHEYELGLLTNDNRPKPVAEAFRALAEAHRGQPAQIPAAVPPPPTEQNPAAVWTWLEESRES